MAIFAPTKKGFLRYFLQCAYDGTPYHGWQVQPGVPTVQQVLNESLSKLLRQPIAVIGAGRTDAGVHARQMVAHFDGESIGDKRDFLYRINALLPPSIAIRSICEVSGKAHARFSALSRTYRYYITREKDPFQTETAYQLTHTHLDVVQMNRAADLLLQYDDFSSFSRSGSDTTQHICAVTEAFWFEMGARLIFEVTADRFLRNMVRALVGTLLDVGMGKRSVAKFEEVIAQKDRGQAGVSAPARGLFLERIRYPEEIYAQV